VIRTTNDPSRFPESFLIGYAHRKSTVQELSRTNWLLCVDADAILEQGLGVHS